MKSEDVNGKTKNIFHTITPSGAHMCMRQERRTYTPVSRTTYELQYYDSSTITHTFVSGDSVVLSYSMFDGVLHPPK